MSYFSSDYLAFFAELSNNNNKIWFDQNRKRYEQSIKVPFNGLVEEMIVRIHNNNPDILIRPPEAIFRINRDIRFSKDKTPYKTHMSALISSGGRKARDIPGFYFQLGQSGIRIYSGVHQLQKNILDQVRSFISKNLNEFDEIITAVKFKSHFKEISGDKHKRLSQEYQNVFIQQPLIANKDFYVMADLDAEYITKPDLSDHLMEYYSTAKPFINFLMTAIKFS